MLGFLNLIALVVLVSLAVHLVNSRVVQRNRRAAEFAQERRVVEADVTRFTEELDRLHIETLSTELDTPTQQDYQQALDASRRASDLLGNTTASEDFAEVARALEDGRFAMTSVVCRMGDQEPPERRSPCFFNPMHGPSSTTVTWANREGRRVPVPACPADAERLTAGAEPDTLQVRRGNRMVPWYAGGPTYRNYVDGYYGTYAANRAFPGFLLASMMDGLWEAAVLAAPSRPSRHQPAARPGDS
ncbi:hypothetical protein [Nocardioides sp. AE5]|uniref:hypothetical protein n=1 Tax=Nocardioides sp. AE5 TaxID=2962573 RepID=UPI002880C527|nr:hypothetical protein [Nocardioides sp. AE5]MDT0201927.1 hypothetical protein [Nocardioides sp. AE5]